MVDTGEMWRKVGAKQERKEIMNLIDDLFCRYCQSVLKEKVDKTYCSRCHNLWLLRNDVLRRIG